jgi:hypothetical protein
VNRVDPAGLSFVDFAAGLGDALLLGQGARARRAIGIDDVVDDCSNAYSYGGWTAFGIGGLRLAYGVAVRGYSWFAASGVAASAFRQNLKHMMRLGLGKGFRPVDLARYKSDDALRAAAGRTNKGVNAYGGGVAISGQRAGRRCPCPR